MFLRSQNIPASIALVAVTFSAVAGSPGYDGYELSPSGYGPVSVGMTVSEASKALGVDLAPVPNLDAEEIEYCHYVYPYGDYEDILAFMVERGVISRVDVRKPGISTNEGLSIGSTGAEISSVYKDRLEIEPHKYTGPEGKYYLVSNDKKYKYIFEVIDGVVVEFRSGRNPSVQYVEGCL